MNKNPPFPLSPVILELKGSTPITRKRINPPSTDDGPLLTDETTDDLFGSQTQKDIPEIINSNSKSILDKIDEAEAMVDEIEKSFRQSDETEDVDDDEGSSDETVQDPIDDANARALRLIKQLEFLHDRQMEIISKKTANAKAVRIN